MPLHKIEELVLGPVDGKPLAMSLCVYPGGEVVNEGGLPKKVYLMPLH
jgi:hypothetical protein